MFRWENHSIIIIIIIIIFIPTKKAMPEVLIRCYTTFEILKCSSDHQSSNLKLLIHGGFTMCWGRLFQSLITLWENEFLLVKRNACFLKILKLWPLLLELSHHHHHSFNVSVPLKVGRTAPMFVLSFFLHSILLAGSALDSFQCLEIIVDRIFPCLLRSSTSTLSTNFKFCDAVNTTIIPYNMPKPT